MDNEPSERERDAQAYLDFCARATAVDRTDFIRGAIVPDDERAAIDGALAHGAYFHVLTYLSERPRGRVFRPSPGFFLCAEPLTIRYPDVGYIESHRLATLTLVENVWLGPPDLAIEVISEGHREESVRARIEDFLRFGTPMAWVVDARNRTLSVHRRKGGQTVFHWDDKIRAAPLFPRFQAHVYEFFGG